MRSQDAFRRSIAACLCCALLAAQAATALGAEARSSVVGWVEIAPASEGGGRFTVIGHVYGLENTAGNFTLAVKRSGKSGVARTAQSGAFTVAPGGATVLAKTAIDASPPVSITIELKLLVGGKEVFSVEMKPAGESSGAVPGREL